MLVMCSEMQAQRYSVPFPRSLSLRVPEAGFEPRPGTPQAMFVSTGKRWQCGGGVLSFFSHL